ncbi:hypothetical protein CCR94_16300 [Rhodoblastus sphagnicola]|uniref:Uncharacterized protein n=1 Tax=Rhodoblastus sphagnicola TaxID=333368 RepID=A0A2S6N2V3_9HYPH|nr:hypothetical protein [Rhodoblastus sphagnicola]MBB4199056.1 hypothetical protein [Rhodoblastus sphagnicola]PPQ28951.1 hypothetical protein CCR94_16300 [Rhodoblastus sphagnicola]
MTAALFSFREAILAQVEKTLPGVAVETHGGTFTLEELKRYSVRAPIAALALVGFGRTLRVSDGRVMLPTRWALVLIAKDEIKGQNRVDRNIAAAAMAGAMTLALEGNRFATAGARRPEDLAAQNEYSGGSDLAGVAIWQVTWTSPLKIGEMIDPDTFGVTDFGVIEAGAIAALSDIWINGVAMKSGDEILTDVTVSAPDAAPLAGTFQPDGSVG